MRYICIYIQSGCEAVVLIKQLKIGSERSQGLGMWCVDRAASTQDDEHGMNFSVFIWMNNFLQINVTILIYIGTDDYR